MSVKITGMQEIVDQLDKMAKVGDKHGADALKKAGTHVKEVEQKVVRSTHDKWSQEVGYKELKRYPVKVGKKGGKFINIGIRAKQTPSQKKKDLEAQANGAKRATHWDRVKGLWYNNYGFFHNKSGAYIAGSDWIGTAYEQSVEGAYQIIRDELEKGMGL